MNKNIFKSVMTEVCKNNDTSRIRVIEKKNVILLNPQMFDLYNNLVNKDERGFRKFGFNHRGLRILNKISREKRFHHENGIYYIDYHFSV